MDWDVSDVSYVSYVSDGLGKVGQDIQHSKIIYFVLKVHVTCIFMAVLAKSLMFMRFRLRKTMIRSSQWVGQYCAKPPFAAFVYRVNKTTSRMFGNFLKVWNCKSSPFQVHYAICYNMKP